MTGLQLSNRAISRERSRNADERQMIMNRLLSVREIDDREPSHRQSHAIAEIETVIVRTAMTNGLIHAREQLAINRSAVFVNYSCNATHGLLRPFLKNLVHHHLQNQAGP